MIFETKDHSLIFYSDPARASVAELLLQAAAQTGFSLTDIKAMVDSELETLQLLEYITAVLSNRMN